MVSRKAVFLMRTCLYLLLLLILNQTTRNEGRDLDKYSSFVDNIQNKTITSGENVDILRKYVHAAWKVGNKSINTNEEEHTIHIAMLRSDSKGRFLGAKASMTVHGFSPLGAVDKRGLVTGMTMVVSSGDFSTHNYNSIHVGWHVVPELYGDSDTHFFVLSTRSGHPGCFNLEPCSGFVLNKKTRFIPGYKLWPLSKPYGKQTYLNLRIDKDNPSGDWNLYSGQSLQDPVGYFPKHFFTTLRDHAESVIIGGEVVYRKGTLGPPMGSGFYAKEGQGVAASVIYPRVKLVPGRYHLDKYTFDLYADDAKCYTIEGDVFRKGVVFLGGPGGCVG